VTLSYYPGYSWRKPGVVPGSNFFNQTHQTTDPTQPNTIHRKVKTLDPQTNPTQPTTQSNPIQPTTNLYTTNQQTKEDNLGTLFHRNITTVSARDAPNCKFTKRTVRYKLRTTSFRILENFLRPTTQPNPTH